MGLLTSPAPQQTNFYVELQYLQMPSIVPKFSFLARLVQEIWRGPKIIIGDKFLYRALVLVNAYQCAKFQLPNSISFRDKEGLRVTKFNVGLLAPCRTPYAETLMCSLKYLERSNSLPNFSIVSQCIMQLCEYVFPIGFPLYVLKNGVFGGFEGEDMKILCSNPQKALPCVNTRLWCIVCRNHINGLSFRSVERFCVHIKKQRKQELSYRRQIARQLRTIR